MPQWIFNFKMIVPRKESSFEVEPQVKVNIRWKKSNIKNLFVSLARLVPVKEPSISFVNRVKYFFASLLTTVIKFPEQISCSVFLKNKVCIEVCVICRT